jgi:hypothetical protein
MRRPLLFEIEATAQETTATAIGTRVGAPSGIAGAPWGSTVPEIANTVVQPRIQSAPMRIAGAPPMTAVAQVTNVIAQRMTATAQGMSSLPQMRIAVLIKMNVILRQNPTNTQTAAAIVVRRTSAMRGAIRLVIEAANVSLDRNRALRKRTLVHREHGRDFSNRKRVHPLRNRVHLDRNRVRVNRNCVHSNENRAHLDENRNSHQLRRPRCHPLFQNPPDPEDSTGFGGRNPPDPEDL